MSKTVDVNCKAGSVSGGAKLGPFAERRTWAATSTP